MANMYRLDKLFARSVSITHDQQHHKRIRFNATLIHSSRASTIAPYTTKRKSVRSNLPTTTLHYVNDDANDDAATVPMMMLWPT